MEVREQMAVNDIRDLSRSWLMSLQAERKAEQTVKNYRFHVAQFAGFLEARGMPTALDRITREYVELWQSERFEAGLSPSTVNQGYWSLRSLFAWAEEEGEIPASPMARMRVPKVPEQRVEMLSEQEVVRLLESMKGSSFEDKRDRAIVGTLAETGLRRSELANVRLADVTEVDLGPAFEPRFVTAIAVVGKGSRPRTVYLADAGRAVMDRYMRARRRHPHAASESLWLGQRGPLGHDAIAKMLTKRGEQVGIVGLRAHRLRHLWADASKRSGLRDEEIERLGGWTPGSRVVRRYAGTALDDRARRAAARHSLLDRLAGLR